MAFFFYILFSKKLAKYYVGHTGNSLEKRVQQHNTNHKGFTGGYGDWELVYSESYESKVDAYKRERIVKGWKSKLKILQLVQSIPT